MTAPTLGPKLTTEFLSKNILFDLIHAAAPCLTLVLPPYRPGEPGKPAAALLKVDLQEAAKKLSARRVAEPVIAELLEPLRQLSHEEESAAGSEFARVIFRSPGVFRQFELLVPPPPAQTCVVGACFWIRPIFNSLALPANVYILDVTKKDVALLRCSFTEVTRVELPQGIPTTLEAALAFDAPDHDLKNRSSAGPSTGAMQGVQFGTGSGREKQHAHLRDFYRMVDRGVNDVLRGTEFPLILAGVDEDTAIYRSINAYPKLLETAIPGSPGVSVSNSQLLRKAHDIARFSFERRIASELTASKERFAPSRFSTDLDAILRAAVEGRVSDLYLDENAQRIGTFEGKIFGGRANWHDEDLLNVAAVETLLASGAVHSLPTHLMPGNNVAAATFRY